MLDIPVRVGDGFARAFEARLVEQTTASWEFWFGSLQRFIEHEGHARVLASHRTESGAALGRWIIKQRSLYRRGMLSHQKAARLEELRISIDGEERALLEVIGYENSYAPGTSRADLRLGIDAQGELYLLSKGDGWIRKLIAGN